MREALHCRLHLRHREGHIKEELRLRHHDWWHRLRHRLRQRLRHIADAAPDKAGGLVRVGLREFVYAPADLRKEVTGFELQKMFVDVRHGRARKVADAGG